MVCTIFVLPKWIEKQQELEDRKLQNQAMALKTKKFVQFLSTENTEKSETEGKELENLNEDKEDNEVEESYLEEKKEK